MQFNYVQNNFLSGVLDPRAKARVETDAYNNALQEGLNIEPVHLGGIRRRPGLRFAARLPNVLTRVTAGVTVTAPNGGTTANANDDSTSTAVTTTVNISTTDPYVVVHYDLGAAQDIVYIDVLDLALTAGTSTQFRIQHSLDNSNWTDGVPPGGGNNNLPLVDTTARSYRRNAGAPSTSFSARYVRLVRLGATDLGTAKATLTGMNVWTESAVVSEVRNLPFEVSTEEQYMLVLTDRSAAVFQDGEVLLELPSPYASADIPDIDAASDAETMVIVHEDYAPRFLLRETTTNFQFQVPTFTVPAFDYADSSSPTPVSDVQTLTFTAGWLQGHTFQIELEGARTGSIVYAGDATAAEQAATAANIARAVQKLYTVEGFSGVTCARTGTRAYTVTFADASANSYDLMSATFTSTTDSITVAKSATGTARSEPVWSSTRGYPRTAAFFESRLYFGGTRSLQQALMGSEVFNILNFEGDAGLSDEPIFTTIAGAKLNAINGLYGGRSLQIFTSGGEFRFVKQEGVPIVPGDTPKLQTEYGAARVRPVNIDGATMFVQRTRKAIRDFRFNLDENSYNSLGVSSLAPHLINDVVDIAAWNGSREDEIGLVFVVNGDGTVAVLNTRKEAEVQAWTQWTTQGEFRAVGVVFEDRYFAVERSIAGVDGLYMEIADTSYYLDCAGRTNSISDLGDGTSAALALAAHLIDEEVRVRADGFVLQNTTPFEPGNIIIEGTGWELVETGLGFEVSATPMPLNTMTPRGPNFMRKRRIVKARAKILNTAGLLINGAVVPDRNFDVNSFDEEAQTRSGNVNLELSTNYDEGEDKTVTFSQVDPLPFELLGIEVQMESQ